MKTGRRTATNAEITCDSIVGENEMKLWVIEIGLIKLAQY